MALTYNMVHGILPKNVSSTMSHYLNSDISAIRYGSGHESGGGSGKKDQEGAKKNNNSGWSTLDTLVITFFIIALLVYLFIIIMAGYSASSRQGFEILWSVIMAAFLPEVWICYHGIDASRAGVGFFSKLPSN